MNSTRRTGKVLYALLLQTTRSAHEVGDRTLGPLGSSLVLLGGEDEYAFGCHPQGSYQLHKEGRNRGSLGGSLGLKGYELASFWLYSCPFRHGFVTLANQSRPYVDIDARCGGAAPLLPQAF